MKKIFFLVLLSVAGSGIYSQVSFDFEDHDLSAWIQYPSNNWVIEECADNNHRLTHSFNNENAGIATISVLSLLDFDLAQTTWSFQIRHGYNPSFSNLWAVFLSSDVSGQEILSENPGNGYVIGVNLLTNNDLLTFYRIDEGQYNTLITTDFNWENEAGTDKETELMVQRNLSGKWEIFVTVQDKESCKVAEITDNFYGSSIFFTIYYKYTASQDMKLWFDNLFISGKAITDNISPKVQSILVMSDSTLEIIFSEPVSHNITDHNSCFLLNELFQPDSFAFSKTDRLILCFHEKFLLDNRITIRQIFDVSENKMRDTTIFFNWYQAKRHDLLITEVMPAPVPSFGLPGKEYIEIFNNCAYPLFIRNWEICINQKCRPINTDIVPSEYVILCDITDTSYFNVYGHVAGITSLYSLPNEESVIEIKNDKEKTIHHISYSKDWHSSVYKQEGGWSFEMIDPLNPCQEIENWASSIHLDGGSPGKMNSVAASNPDTQDPSLLRVSVLSENSIRLFFSENMSVSEIYNSHMYEIDGIDLITTVSENWPGSISVNIELGKSLKKDQLYTIRVNEKMTDCAGNPIDKNYAVFACPLPPDSNTLVINEILFDGGWLGTEFIEIYNRGSYPVDLDKILIAIREDYTGELKNMIEIETPGYLLLPGEYFAITNNVKNLKQQYIVKVPEHVIENSLPALNNEEATLVICDLNMQIIDMVHYSAAWHYPLLSTGDGVSLERIHPDHSSLLVSNWHSASSTSGYATPGYENSQSLSEENAGDLITIEPEIFSPDNDGYNDLLTINLNPEKEGYIAYIKIFDAKGRPVKLLVNNLLIGTQDSFHWDGTNHANKIQPIGIYIVFVRLFNMAGEVKEFKKVCVLGGKTV